MDESGIRVHAEDEESRTGHRPGQGNRPATFVPIDEDVAAQAPGEEADGRGH